jgi:Pyruvate/2-oxoacid:ferredoxin oxidoreductase delta subunit
VNFRVAIYEDEAASPFDAGDRFAILRGLLEKGYRVFCLRKGSPMASAESGSVMVLGRFGDQLPQTKSDGALSISFHNVDGMAAPAIIDLVDRAHSQTEDPAPGKWKPWFPVIDYSRCTNCMQCLSFCLFEVYGVSKEGKIQVQNQPNCKTECPACSRVCPEVAILFPKYRHSPINGDEVNTDDIRREAMKVDISALLGGDIYSMLRDRSAKSKSRFSKERDDERALKERQNCLAKLQQEGGIPAEVLAALPSPAEILAKAEAAKARAHAAIEQNGRQADPQT